MLRQLKAGWKELRKDPPGQRFQARHRRGRQRGNHPLRRIAMLGAGTFLFAAGLFMLIAPGPGILALGAGAALVAQESLAAAKALDWLELKIRSLISALR